MRFSSRSKVSILVSLTALVVMLGGIFAYALVSNKTTAHAAGAATSFSGSMTSAKVAGTINPTQLGSTASPGKTRIFPFHGRPTASASIAHTSALSRPTANGVKMFASGALLHNFDGVSATQSALVNGFDLEPPDEAVAVGGGYVFNFVNVAGAFYKPNGQLVAGPFSGNAFLNEPASAFLSDTRAYYDAPAHTWYALMLEIGFTGAGESHLDLAVNPTSNPLSTWTIYRIDTTDSINAGCPCLPDYPIFGIDQYNIYISTNEFSIAGPQFNGAQIYAIAKSQLMSGAPSPNVVHFSNLSLAGVISYHVQPAITLSNSPAEYFLGALDPNNTFDNRLGLWGMTNRNKIAQGVMPNLSAMVISSEAYAMPPNAQTPVGFNAGVGAATTGLVQTDFDAMQEVEYLNGHLYGSLNTAVNIPGDTVARSGIAWFDVAPSISGGVVGGSSAVADQGYITVQGEYLLYPHIQVSKQGTTAIVFSLGGPGTFLSAAYIVRQPGAKHFGNVQLAAAGAAPDNGFGAVGGAGRWGDYSAGQLDPSGHGIWFATQYIPNNGDQFENWGNRVFEVQG